MLELFAYHAKGYWSLIGVSLVVCLGRLFVLVSDFFASSSSSRLPNEALVWLALLSAMPLAVHLLAGVAEVSINNQRRARNESNARKHE